MTPRIHRCAGSFRGTACVVAAWILAVAGCGGSSSTPGEEILDGAIDSAAEAGAPPIHDAGMHRDAERADAAERDAHDDEASADATIAEAGALDGGTDATASDGTAFDSNGIDGSLVDSSLSDGSPAEGAVAESGATDGSAPESAPSNFPVGTTCSVDTDCASQLCKPVVLDSGSVCVTPCTQQTDCVPSVGYFCEPITAGSASGYCIPQSPAHCLSCAQDSDCGSLSEVCFQAPGDNANSCNIDCSLAGAAACPSDYSCVDETVGGQARKLCRPTSVPTCLDALGGFCDRLETPQPCTRDNASGTCTGQRVCLGSQRFDTCGALAPQCKTDCSVQDPAGCTETFCAGATVTPTNCGSCGAICPGYLQTADNVTCQDATTCTFSCQGENYDIDGNPANGCESPDAPQGNHTVSAAASEGSVSDCDTGTVEFTFSGVLLSDTRAHQNPTVLGFDTASGSAPDWYSIIGVGHTFCSNDIVMTLAIQGSGSPSCYQFTVITDKNTYTCPTDATGSCGFNNTSGGQFSDNTTIDIEVSKTCSTSVTEDVSYTVSGHL
jgi:hypothetical protein